MNKKQLESLVKNVDNQLFEIINHLICSICHELLNKPVTTPCGHCFCSGCIRRVLSTKDNSGCPLCKNPVKRYNLEPDKVKSTLTDICKGLPSAFKKDVQDFNLKLSNATEDLLKTSKLTQLLEFTKDFKTSVRKSYKPKPEVRSQNENECGTFVPVLKRAKNVIEYTSAKKKRMDDLVSISQTEAASNSSICASFEVEKKLEKIEKLPAEVKVKEWFDAVGDNIYLNSPNSLVESLQEENEGKEKRKSEMIRRDYKKSGNPLQLRENEGSGDPYEFVPSQNNVVKKKRQRRSIGKVKKIIDFQALQSFTKESIKRTAIINNQREPEMEERKEELPKSQNVFTASQKFDKLLSETKKSDKSGEAKSHTLYSASQASSPKLLDCSFQSLRRDRCSKKKLLLSDDAEDSGEVVELFKDSSASKGKRRSKRRRSVEARRSNEKKKKVLPEETRKEENVAENDCRRPTSDLLALLEELVNDDVIYSNLKTNSVKYSVENKQTETSNSAPVPRVKTYVADEPDISQDPKVIGFCTQVELPEVKKFKQMVVDMEEELNSEKKEVLQELKTTTNQTNVDEYKRNFDDSNRRTEKTKEGNHSSEIIRKESPAKPTELPEKQYQHQKNLVPFNLLGKIKKNKILFIEFFRFGRLTPTVKRSKSSVVKLVFPTGLSSLTRKRTQSKVAVGVQTSTCPSRTSAAIQTSQAMEDSPRAKSAAVQTSQALEVSPTANSAAVQTSQALGREFPTAAVQTSQILTRQSLKVSAGVQTSQCLKSSAMNQTSQRENFSVEAQTTRRFTSSGIQTTQTDYKTSEEIQTTQAPFESAVVQTSQVGQNWTTQKSVSEAARKTPPVVDISSSQSFPNSSKKPFFTHRKIVKEDSPDQTEYFIDQSPASSSVGAKLQIQDLLTDENSSKNSWSKFTQKNNENFVEMKNRKNRVESKKKEESPDRQSEDSDVQPVKKPSTLRVLSDDFSSPIARYGTRQMIPLDIRKVTQDEQFDVIDLGTPKLQEENSEEQLLRVLKNIDMDMPERKKKPEDCARGEKSEESDSDLFVEQTPPRQRLPSLKDKTKATAVPQDLEVLDLIGDSIPKAMLETESFLMLSAPEKILLTPKKISIEEKWTPKGKEIGKVPQLFDLKKTNENDQNQLNAEVNKKQEKANIETWKRSPKKGNSQQRRKLCIVASSVKNPEMIKKFAGKFKIEQSNKPTKTMTHLIVGLHENDEGEDLPLCTPKLLFAMANKKWIVSELWVETCLKMGKILAEENFETPDPLGGCGCRNARLSTDFLLRDCEVFFMGAFQTISKEDLAELIVDCGGKLVVKPEKFSFSPEKIRMIIADRDCLSMNEKQVQELYEKYSTVILSRDAIIMSIQSYKLANFTPYLLHPAPEEDLIKMGYPPSLARNEEEEGEGEEEDGRWNSAK